MRTVDRDERRLVVMEAAIKQFAGRGYEKSSISRIAREAGVATGGIYNYFRNKEELFASCCHHVFDGFLLGLDKVLDSVRPIYEAILYTLRFLRSHPDYARLILLEARNFSVRFSGQDELHVWEGKLAEHLLAKVPGILPPAARENPRFYLALILGGIEHIVILWLFNPGSLQLSEEQIAASMEHIISPEQQERQ